MLNLFGEPVREVEVDPYAPPPSARLVFVKVLPDGRVLGVSVWDRGARGEFFASMAAFDEARRKAR